MFHDRSASALAAVFAAAVLIPSILTAQITFQRTYGGASYDYGFSVQQTADAGYVVAGATGSFGAGNGDAYLIKLDALGDTQWTRTYGDSAGQDAYSVQQTADGGYILAGGAEWSGFDAKVYLVRTDAGGETLWTRTFGRDSQEIQRAEHVQQTADGGFVLAGQSMGYEPNKVSFVIRTDANGDSLWAREFGGPDSGNCFVNSVQQTTDHGYILCGWTDTVSRRSDAYLVKLDSVGATMWTAAFGDTGMQESYWVDQTADGGYIMVGVTNYSGWSDDEDVYVVRADANGSALWMSVIREPNEQLGSTIHQTSDDGYALGGWARLGLGDSLDMYLARMDADGDMLWTRKFGGNARDVGCSSQPTTDGGYIIAGYTTSFGAGGIDVYVIKTDSLGNVGVAEQSLRPQAISLKQAATVLSGASGVRILASCVVYDAMGRQMLSPKPGIYFVKDPQAQAKAQAVRKVLLVR